MLGQCRAQPHPSARSPTDMNLPEATDGKGLAAAHTPMMQQRQRVTFQAA